MWTTIAAGGRFASASPRLLGQQGRFDGGHTGDGFLTETFGRLLE